MGIFANILSFFSMNIGLENSRETLLIFLAEPECPKELL